MRIASCRLQIAIGFTLAAVLVSSGCSRQSSTGAAKGSRGVPDDSMEAARDQLRKDPDLAAVQAALQQVNSYLSGQASAGLGEAAAQHQEQRAQKGNPFGLEPEEMAEVDGSTFTLLDGQHIEMCF